MTRGMGLEQVDVGALELRRFAEVLDTARLAALERAAARGREVFAGRRIWNVNSTARGGGVAEMLVSLLAYARGAGIDARWSVIAAEPGFFTVTKRLHNHLHGAAGDGGPLGEAERTAYERALAPNATALREQLAGGDLVILHDPQTAGLIPAVKAAGVPVVWRCHIGVDLPNDTARGAWRFLEPYVRDADAVVFSREAFAWEGLDGVPLHVIAPSIDAFAPKNQDLDAAAVAGILAAAEIVDGGGEAGFTRLDGSRGRIEHRADVDPLGADDRYVLQVSRWDRLKDPRGVIDGFAEHIAPRCPDLHLICAGPAVEAVSDDPEGAEVLEEARARVRELDGAVRARVRLAALPMDDLQENAAIVNALQRRAAVVVQKSIAEGFGLTVAEAMWKGRPVVASRIGGIQEQIVDGVSGRLLDDPEDLAAFGAAVAQLVEDPATAERMGAAARDRVRDEFLAVRHLEQYLDLLAPLAE
jgi:trehalose synthase